MAEGEETQPSLEDLQTAQTELQKQLDAAKNEIAESTKSSQQKDAELQRLNDAYQRDVQTLTTYAQQLYQQSQQRPNQAEEDPEAFVSRKDLNSMVEQMGQQFQTRLAQTLTPIEEQRLRDQREQNRREARRSLDNFGKYEDEIQKLLDSQPLEVSSRPGAYEAAHRLVMSQHLDELIDEKLKARSERSEDDEEGEEEEEPVVRTRSASEAPVPTGTATGSRAAVRRQKVSPLSQDEKFAAQAMGLKDAQEFRQWSDPDVEVDVFGFKGRDRV